MSPRSKAAVANLIWVVVGVAMAGAVAGLLAGSLLASTEPALWLWVPLSLVLIGPLAAVVYTNVSWRLGHRPVTQNAMPLVVGLAQAFTLYWVARRILSDNANALDSLSRGGLVFLISLIGLAVAAVAGAIAVLFLSSAEFPEG